MEKKKQDMKGRLARLTVWALLSLLPEVCHSQDFSADVIYEPAKVQDGSAHPRPPAPSRLYVSKDKMRLESQGFSGTTMLVDLANHTATLLLPGQKAYEELGAGPEQYFRVGDAEDACPDWQKAVPRKIACVKVGNETADGRKAVKYEDKGAASSASSTFVWVDPSLKFVIKWEDANGGAALHNIKEGPQAAELFNVPASYQVLQPRKKPPTMPKRPK